MKLSYKWLKDYVALNDSITPQIIADKLSTSGFEIEEFFNTGCDIDGVIIGEVLSRIDHPNADKLSVCKVDLGDYQTQIVCGAPNVDKGQKVPVATVGTDLGNGFIIKATTIRGQESNGMICSESELNLSNESDGIMVLDTTLENGTPFREYFSDHDVVFDLSITPNRPDCLSHIGIAKELSVMFNTDFKYPEPNIEFSNTNTVFNLKIDDDTNCERYTAQIIKNIKVGPSPKWLKDRLNAVGLRSINNLVDISNYIMFDLGQPMHFYDMDDVKDCTLHVKKAYKDENVVTLDDKSRVLTGTETIIYDSEKFAGLGGMIGGQDTEVKPHTKNVLVEAAIWNQVDIQKKQRELNLLTDASYRYSKGVDHNLPILAQKKAMEMILDLCGGEAEGCLTDYQKFEVKPHTVKFRENRNNLVLGMEISSDKITNILTSLDFKKSGDEWIIPTSRQDITREIDLVEEVARIIGLDQIPAKASTVVNYKVEQDFELLKIDELKEFLTANGLNEIITNSMVNLNSQKRYSKKNPVEIVNPLSDEMNAMRLSIIPSMLKVIEYNLNRQNSDLKLFEINKDYFAKKTKVFETQKLVVALTGARHPIHWDEASNKVDFYDIKGLAESVLDWFNFPSHQLLESDFSFLDSESLKIDFKNNPIGFFGKIDKTIIKDYKINQEVYVFELNLDALFSIVKPKTILAESISKFPQVERDIAVIINKKTKSEDMIAKIKTYCGSMLKDVIIVDKYRNNDKYKKDEYSLSFRLYLQSDKTLTDEEIDPIFHGVINMLEKEFNAYLRDH